jgi:hypothetical protein
MEHDNAVSEFTLLFVLDLHMQLLKCLKYCFAFIVLLHDLKFRSKGPAMSLWPCVDRFITLYGMFKPL